MADREVWKDIPGYEGRYQVSNMGRVKSLGRVTELNDGKRRIEPELIMKYTLRSGYPTLILRRPGERKSAQIHRLVAQAFVPNPYDLPIVNHLDYDRTNNRAENLEWCTPGDNVRYSAKNMSHPRKKVTSNTGEKYISKIGTKYRVNIHYRNTTRSKIFRELQDAIDYRNRVVTWEKYTIQN